MDTAGVVPGGKTPGRQTAPETATEPAGSRLAGSHSVTPARHILGIGVMAAVFHWRGTSD